MLLRFPHFQIKICIHGSLKKGDRLKVLLFLGGFRGIEQLFTTRFGIGILGGYEKGVRRGEVSSVSGEPRKLESLAKETRFTQRLEFSDNPTQRQVLSYWW